jgi:hypothetical protein
MKDDNLGTKTWKLWYVWVALIHAILRENHVLGDFKAFIAGLQRTLPEDWMKHQDGESLRKHIHIALKFADTSRSKELSKLLTYWGSFDRVRRSTDPALENLIQREHLLIRSKKVLKA